MRFGFRALWAALALLAATSVANAQPVCEGVSTSCAVEDLGNSRYKMTLTVTNNSSGDNVIFKWSLNSPFAPSEWETVSFTVPTDWSGSHPGSHLQFQTPNGDFRTGRIFSPSTVANCGGVSTLVFEWVFDNLGGPVPTCSQGAIDYTYHMQGLDAECANLGQSFVCPGVVPIESTTWGEIKHIYDK